MEQDLERSLSESHAELLALRDGDASVLGRLTENLRPYLKFVVRKELMSLGTHSIREDDSDIVQQTLLQAVHHLEQFRGESLPEWKMWLVAIAKNQIRLSSRFWKAERRSTFSEVEWSPSMALQSEVSSPSTAMQREELSGLLQQALTQLSEPQQQLIQWRQQEGMSHAEIANRLNITEEASRQRCKSAMDALRLAWKKLN
jgi:RNA polymerase sigma-70 factor, ECF subfamily